MIDLSEEAVDYNISMTRKYLERAAPASNFYDCIRDVTNTNADEAAHRDGDR
jgi:fructose/tagatose bisphosphate aldolase